MHDKAKFMQFMLSHGCASQKDVVAFLGTIKDPNRSQVNDEDATKAVEAVNKTIESFNMMIRSAYDRNTRQRYYAIISTVDNDITRQASHHTEKEFEFFRLIWQELQDGSSDLKTIYRMGAELKLHNYKDLIEEWKKKYWLYENDGQVSLGVRADLELDVLRMSAPSSSLANNQSTNSVEGTDDDD